MEKIENAAELVGKKVTLSVLLKEPNADGHEVDEVTGKVEAANEAVIMIKPSGTATARMFEAEEIDTIAEATTKPKVFRSRRYDPVTADKVRQHLLLVHGLPLDYVNGLTDAQGIEAHGTIDHGPLGHHHAEKANKTEGTSDDPTISGDADNSDDDDE